MSQYSDEIVRLFKCYVETVTDFICEYADSKILQPSRKTLQSFLEDEKHFFYHQLDEKPIPCCECPPHGCFIGRQRKMDKNMFLSLYDSTGTIEAGHRIISGGSVQQECIHKYIAKNIDIEDLDITMLCYMLLTKASITAVEKGHIEMVKKYRNEICHIWTENNYTSTHINTIWSELEGALIGLTTKSAKKKMIKTLFQGNKTYSIGKDDSNEILQKVEKIAEHLEQQKNHWIQIQAATRNIYAQIERSEACLKSTIKDEVASIKDEVASINENQQNYIKRLFEDMIRTRKDETENKFHYKVGNAEITINYPKSQVFVPSHGVSDDHCKALWYLETPLHWNVQKVEATITANNAELKSQSFQTQFVKKGSLWLYTTVPRNVLCNQSTFESEVKSFLSKLIEVCCFDTSNSCQIEVVLSILRDDGQPDIDCGSKNIDKSTQTECEGTTQEQTESNTISVTGQPDIDCGSKNIDKSTQTECEGTTQEQTESNTISITGQRDIDYGSKNIEKSTKTYCEETTQEHTDSSIFSMTAKMASFFDKNIQLDCEEHKRRYQYYCRSHDCVICQKCRLESHKKCKDTLEIEDVSRKVKSSAVFEDLWTNIKTNHQAVLNAIIDREENVKKLQKKKEKLSREVKEKTQNPIDQIKKLENKTLSELESVVNEIVNEITATTKILESNKRKLGELLEQEELIKKQASNFETFIITKQMEREVQESEEILHKLSEKGAMDNTDIEMNENITADDTIFGIKTLCDIKVSKEKNTTSIDINKPNIGHAEVKTRFPRQLTLKQQFTVDQGWYYGCCTLPNGLLVLTDCYDGVVNILHSNGQHKSSVRFNGGSVYDVTVINENHVAVSNPLHKTISIIDVDRSKIIKTLQIKSPVRGITHSDGYLYFCVPKVGIRKINIDTEKIDKLHDDRTVDVKSYIDTDGNRICYTCPLNNKIVTVLDSDLRVIFTFKDHNTMSRPFGISMDEHQNIFVCDHWKHNLLLISRDGDKHEVVVSRVDELYHPLCVHYDKVNHHLTVVDLMMVVRIFTVY